MTSFLFFTLFPTLFWTARSATGTIWNCLRPLERAKRYWNGLRPMERPPGLLELPLASGTAFGLWNALRPLEQSLWLYLERPPGPWNCAPRLWNGRKALAALVLFVGRR